MNHSDRHGKLLTGIVLLLIAGIIFTGSVQGQETPTSVTPLSTISSYQLPKEPETPNSPNASQPELNNTPNQNGDENEIPIPIPVSDADIEFERVCEPLDITRREETNCTITIKNNTGEDFYYKILDWTSSQLCVLEDTVEGSDFSHQNIIIDRGLLAGGTLPSISIEKMDSSLVYNSLGELGIPPLTDMLDDGMINVATLEPYLYNGMEYTTIGIGSNGYLIPGLGSDEDIAYIPQIFPDPEIPNNVIAPFWTDLNPEAAGAIYAALLTRDDESWVVIEWEDVPAFDSEKPVSSCVENCADIYTFQVWLKTNTTEQDITFIYEQVNGEGAASGLNIGVENQDGTVGTNYELVPAAQDELVVVTTPGTEGETHVISYTAKASTLGTWHGCSLLKVFGTRGVAFDCVSGSVTR